MTDAVVLRAIATNSEQWLNTLTSVPWYVWCTLAGITSVMIGVQWDISWHISIGRDTFWTPAHIAIYMCGVLAGAAYGYLILKTTFRAAGTPLRAASVRILGLRGPLGAFIAGWGGITMLTSGPFDNWWHDAYGLDVKVMSPPHVVLFIGIFGVLIGTLVFIASLRKRAIQVGVESLYRALFLYVCCVLLVMEQVLITEFTSRKFLHMHQAYVLIALFTLFLIGVARRGSDFRWAATTVCGFYTVYRIGLILVLPLFPAEPKLGPVFHQVTHFIPPSFPLLLLVPAVLLDLFWQNTKGWPWWLSAPAASVVFTLALSMVQWPFSDFLQSPLSRNWFFGTGYMGFAAQPASYEASRQYFAEDSFGVFVRGLIVACVVGSLSLSFGDGRGAWLRRVRR